MTSGMVIPDSKTDKLFIEATKNAPSKYVEALVGKLDYQSESSVLFPKTPHIDRCRLCGEICKLTEEHIPPKASGNVKTYKNIYLDDWLEKKLEAGKVTGRRFHQGGIRGYTLCGRCNSLTGTRYGGEYTKWSRATSQALSSLTSEQIRDFDSASKPLGVGIEFVKVRPGAFVRQVLSFMCSLSGDWDIAGRHPEIKRIVLGSECLPLPKGLDISMAVYLGPSVRMMGPQLRMNYQTGHWNWWMELAYPPFSFVMSIASSRPVPDMGLLLNELALVPPNSVGGYSGEFDLGFGWSPYPGDYRSRSALKSSS